LTILDYTSVHKGCLVFFMMQRHLIAGLTYSSPDGHGG
jgi:hypothetical protein